MQRFGYATVSDCFNMTWENREEEKTLKRNSRYSSLTNLGLLNNQNYYLNSNDTNIDERDSSSNINIRKDGIYYLPIREILHVPISVENKFQTNSNKKQKNGQRHQVQNSNKKISESIEYRMNSGRN